MCFKKPDASSKHNLTNFITIFRLVSGAGDIKITKDGNVLLHEMQIQHPTASLIARASTAQDDMTGDGTTSTVLLIGELLKQADIFLAEGLHPRILSEGFDLARAKALTILDSLKHPIEVSSPKQAYHDFILFRSRNIVYCRFRKSI